MKYSMNRVALFSWPLRVAVTIILPFEASGLMNSPLALAISKTTIRWVGSADSKAWYSTAERSGPTRLNFASLSKDPWPIRKTKSKLSALSSVRSDANTFLTSSAVAGASPGSHRSLVGGVVDGGHRCANGLTQCLCYPPEPCGPRPFSLSCRGLPQSLQAGRS